MNNTLQDIDINLFYSELTKRSIDWQYIGDCAIITASLGERREYITETLGHFFPANYLPLWGDKFCAKEFVRSQGIPVAQGRSFNPDEFAAAKYFARAIHYPVVLKPTNGSNGALALVNIACESDFIKLWEELFTYVQVSNLLVESFFAGTDYRFLITAKEEIYVVSKHYAEIYGDGVRSLSDLCSEEEKKRQNFPGNYVTPLPFSRPESTFHLRQHQLDLDEVPARNESIVLSYNASMEVGALSHYHALENIHASFLDLAKRQKQFFPAAAYVCFDLIVKDIQSAATAENFVFCNYKIEPGYGMFMFPSYGKPQNVVAKNIDYLFPETAIDE